MRVISKFSKITEVIYPKTCPNQPCDYWLITTNQQTVRIETNVFNSEQLQNNTFNGAMSITINRVVTGIIQVYTYYCFEEMMFY